MPQKNAGAGKRAVPGKKRTGEAERKGRLPAGLAPLILILGLALSNWAQPIIVDHRHADLAKVPVQWIKKAKSNLRVVYQHTSHGSQLVTGIQALAGALGSPFTFTSSSSGYSAGDFLNDYGIPGASDLGSPNFTAWYDATRNLLNRSGGCDRNVVMWSWCGQVSGATAVNIDTYLGLMNQLETDFPGVRFVYITGHLDGSGVAGGLNQRNEQIRAYCRANNKVLFDFADIESYDPDGAYFLDLGATDGCYYSGGNWAQQWLAARPGSDLAAIAAGCGSCAHSERLNCVLKGRTLWWLWARLAGWPGADAGPVPGDLDGDGLDEAAVDFGANGMWALDGGSWTALSSYNPDGLLAADVDGDGAAEVVADFGYRGLWLRNAGAWNKISSVNAEALAAADTDADGVRELAADFGKSGLWLWDDDIWTPLSGRDAAGLAAGPVEGASGEAVAAGFGPAGLWLWSGGAWTQLSGVEPEAAAVADLDGDGSGELAGDFGAAGLWAWDSGAWTQLSGLNPDYLSAAAAGGAGAQDLLAGFGAFGLWRWRGGSWTQLGGVRAEGTAAADFDGGGPPELAADFGALGLWLWDGSVWEQLTSANPESLVAADFDGDGPAELAADFGAAGLWLRKGGAWTSLSANDPE